MTKMCVVHAIEAAFWGLGVLAAFMVGVGTLSATFPARDRALIGEAVVLACFAGLGALATRRALDADEHRFASLFVIARVTLCTPTLTFALVASASGFAA